jgi:hypothetical protein
MSWNNIIPGYIALEILKERSMSTKSKKVTELNKKIDQIHALVRECELLAEETDHSFSLSIAYGMGGTYSRTWEDSDSSEEGTWEWQASSQSC